MIVWDEQPYFDLEECRDYLPVYRAVFPEGSALRTERDALHAERARWAHDRAGIESGRSPYAGRLQALVDQAIPLIPPGTDPRRFLFFALHATDGQLSVPL